MTVSLSSKETLGHAALSANETYYQPKDPIIPKSLSMAEIVFIMLQSSR